MRHAIATLLRACGVHARRVRPVAQVCCHIRRISCTSCGDVSPPIQPAESADAAPFEAEIAWLRALADEGLPVPRPIVDDPGRLLHRWGTPTRRGRRATRCC